MTKKTIQIRSYKFSGASSERFEGVFLLLDECAKFLGSVGADEASLRDLKRVISYLKKIPDDDRRAILETGRVRNVQMSKKGTEELSEERTKALSLSEIEDLLVQTGLTRAQLERVATLRFGMSKGALSPLPREALIDKLRTLVGHEGTHESIARVAAGGSEQKAQPAVKEGLVPKEPAVRQEPTEGPQGDGDAETQQTKGDPVARLTDD